MIKIIPLFALAALFSCTAYQKQPTKAPRQLSLTVSHIQRDGKGGEIWALTGPYLYFANCPTIPDSLKAGSIITADPVPDSCECKCVFKKFVRKPQKSTP